MLEYLACPVDKTFPLELYELESNELKVSAGVLVCSKCLRYFPISDGIPVMFPDYLRTKESDLEFLAKWKDKLPDKIIKQGNPWHI
jgi:uncharacterized protein